MLNSFYAKLSALFLVLIVGLGLILSVLGVRSARRYADEVEQKLNRTLAEEMVPRFEPLLRDSIAASAIEAKIRDMTGINRRIEIYLLEADGTLKASFAASETDIEQRRVSLAPVRRFMNGADLPILGDDPRDADQPKPFSVADIEIMGQTGCYLYVVLGSEKYASVARPSRTASLPTMSNSIPGLRGARRKSRRLRSAGQPSNSAISGENSDSSISSSWATW